MIDLYLADVAHHPVHDSLWLVFCAWNVLHHMVYTSTRLPLVGRRVVFNAAADGAGNLWRHLVLLTYFPDQSWLFFLNYYHLASHALGVTWYLYDRESMLRYLGTFQRREMNKIAFAFNWLTEQNDMAFYAVTAFVVGAQMNPWLAMAVLMFALPILLQRQSAIARENPTLAAP